MGVLRIWSKFIGIYLGIYFKIYITHLKATVITSLHALF